MMEKSRKILCYIYWGLMFVVYPFVMTDGYFNISKAKLTGFYIVSIVLILGTVINLIMMTNNRRILFLNEIKENRIFIGLCTGCFLSILLTGIINKNLIYSMGGEYEYGVGFIFLTVLIINVLCVNGFHGNSIVYTYLALAPGCIVATMSWLQYMGVDVAGLLVVVLEEQRQLLIGTFGNLAFTGFYFVILFPIAVYGFISNEAKALGIVSMVFLSIGVIITNTDGTLLAFVVEWIVMLFLLKKDKEKARDLFIVAIIIMMSWGALGFINIYSHGYIRLDAVERAAISLPVVLGGLVAAACGFALTKWAGNGKWLGVVSWTLLIVLIMYPVMCAVYTLHPFGNTASFLGKLFYFDYHWGTDRGYLWRSAVAIFADGSFAQKLFGRGTGSFLQAYLYDYSYGIDAIEMGLYSNEDAHNIYLQFLCEYGVVGVGLALGAIIYRLRTRFSSGDLFLQLRAVAFIGAMVSSAFLVVQGITLGFFGVIL